MVQPACKPVAVLCCRCSVHVECRAAMTQLSFAFESHNGLTMVCVHRVQIRVMLTLLYLCSSAHLVRSRTRYLLLSCLMFFLVYVLFSLLNTIQQTPKFYLPQSTRYLSSEYSNVTHVHGFLSLHPNIPNLTRPGSLLKKQSATSFVRFRGIGQPLEKDHLECHISRRSVPSACGESRHLSTSQLFSMVSVLVQGCSDRMFSASTLLATSL